MRDHVVPWVPLKGPKESSEAFTVAEDLEPESKLDQLEVGCWMPYRQRHPTGQLAVLFPCPPRPFIAEVLAETIHCPHPNPPPSRRADRRGILKAVAEVRPARRLHCRVRLSLSVGGHSHQVDHNLRIKGCNQWLLAFGAPADRPAWLAFSAPSSSRAHRTDDDPHPSSSQRSHVQQSSRQFFNHALDRDLIPRNVFTRLGVRKRTRRIDRPGFEVISNDQYQRLCRCAHASRTDSYGLILEGVILAIGEAAMRPGEIFALNHSDVDYTAGLIHVRRQLDLAIGVAGWPKDDEQRAIAMTPKLHRHLQSMPKLSEEILFPTPRGCYMRRSTWSAHWRSVRAAAQMPGLEFYELRHRAIQWMIDPPHDGGLGLDIQTTAHIAGHRDGGYLVCSTYSKLAEHRALTRTRRALNAYQEREQNRRHEQSKPAITA